MAHHEIMRLCSKHGHMAPAMHVHDLGMSWLKLSFQIVTMPVRGVSQVKTMLVKLQGRDETALT